MTTRRTVATELRNGYSLKGEVVTQQNGHGLRVSLMHNGLKAFDIDAFQLGREDEERPYQVIWLLGFTDSRRFDTQEVGPLTMAGLLNLAIAFAAEDRVYGGTAAEAF